MWQRSAVCWVPYLWAVMAQVLAVPEGVTGVALRLS